jgi:hypothetical protein
MGNMAMGECKNWKRKSCIAQINYKHFKGGYGRLPLGNVYTCHGFLSRPRKFEKPNSKTFFHKFITRFVDKGFGFPRQPPINKIYET